MFRLATTVCTYQTEHFAKVSRHELTHDCREKGEDFVLGRKSLSGRRLQLKVYVEVARFSATHSRTNEVCSTKFKWSKFEKEKRHVKT